MNELIKFSRSVTVQWEGLPQAEILSVIQESFKKTKCNYTCELLNIQNSFGIYAFFIKPKVKNGTIQELEKIWNTKGFEKFPKIIKKRYSTKKGDNGWFNFYIGKSEKLQRRIFEHCDHHSKHPTYGLKLKEREEFFENNEIQIGYWLLPDMSGADKKIKQFIITNLESALREEMQPWVGKQ